MITQFGKCMRSFRKSHGLRQKDMAKDIAYTQTMISKIECGECDIPDGYIDKITYAYHLSEQEADEMKKCAIRSNKIIKINSNNYNNRDWELITDFYSKFDDIEFREKKIIRDILGKI